MVKVYNFNNVFRAFDDDGRYLGTVNEGKVIQVLGKAYYGVADDNDVRTDERMFAEALKAEFDVKEDTPCNGDCVGCPNDSMEMDLNDIDETAGVPKKLADDIMKLMNEANVDCEFRDGELYFATAEDRDKGDKIVEDYMKGIIDGMLEKILETGDTTGSNLDGIKDGEQDAEIVVRCKERENGNLQIDIDIIGRPSVDLLNKMYISLGNAVFQYNNNH